MRLIIVFILIVIISGGILTTLSINTISNFKELTEKKILEEEQVVARRILLDLSAYLDSIKTSAQGLSGRDDYAFQSIRSADYRDQEVHSFLISRDGSFIWPWYLEQTMINPEPGRSSAFLQLYTNAEAIEYRQKEYSGALSLYRSALVHGKTKTDSMVVYNAIARVYLKMGDPGKAVMVYNRILKEGRDLLDENGFPFAYYAVLNMLKMENAIDPSLIYDALDKFITQLDEGSIPLNRSTEEILDRITEWIQTYSKRDDPEDPRMDRMRIQGERIKAKIRLVKQYGKVIKAALAERSDQIDENIPDIHQSIFRVPGGDDELMLLYRAGEHYAISIINIEGIRSDIIQKEYVANTEYAYNIMLLKNTDASQAGNDAGFFASLSPWFPAYDLHISLEDSDLVETFIRRRSWTYGIALMLLMGAMVLGILLILRDVLREKRLSRLRSDFVANVTHELKTPLTSIALFTESILLNRITSGQEKKEYLALILKETERLKHIINNVLTFSRTEKGRIEYRTERVNLTDLVRSSLSDLSYRFEEANFSVEQQLEDNVFLLGDAETLKQALINLFDNAIKYSPDERKIFVRLFNTNDRIRLEIEDRGIGIPGDQADLIFEKFYRINSNSREGIGGTGLGLTVVREFITAHQGEIMVESGPDKGSKFIILLNSLQ